MSAPQYDLYTIPNYNTGVAVEIKYFAPTSNESVQFILRKDEDNYMFVVAIRYGSKEFILNTKLDGHWGSEERYNDKFNFDSNMEVVIRIQAMPADYFSVFVNGQNFAKFPYRYQPVTNVVKGGYLSNVKFATFSVQY